MANQPLLQGHPTLTAGPTTTTTSTYMEVTRVSDVHWGAIVAGALFGFATTLVLTTLGMAIGITATEPTPREPGGPGAGDAAQAVGIGSAIWWLVTVFLTGLFGG